MQLCLEYGEWWLPTALHNSSASGIFFEDKLIAAAATAAAAAAAAAAVANQNKLAAPATPKETAEEVSLSHPIERLSGYVSLLVMGGLATHASEVLSVFHRSARTSSQPAHVPFLPSLITPKQAKYLLTLCSQEKNNQQQQPQQQQPQRKVAKLRGAAFGDGYGFKDMRDPVGTLELLESLVGVTGASE